MILIRGWSMWHHSPSPATPRRTTVLVLNHSIHYLEKLMNVLGRIKAFASWPNRWVCLMGMKSIPFHCISGRNYIILPKQKILLTHFWLSGDEQDIGTFLCFCWILYMYLLSAFGFAVSIIFNHGLFCNIVALPCYFCFRFFPPYAFVFSVFSVFVYKCTKWNVIYHNSQGSQLTKFD